MFSKLILLVTLLAGTAHAAYFPSFGINNYDALGVYNLSQPTLSDGAVGQLQLDSNGNLRTVQSGTPALPTGAATSALQTSGNASLTSIDGKIVAVNTGAVVVSSSALPSGASTSALQTSGNTSLSTIATNSGTQATAANQTTANSSLSTIATNTTAITGQLPATLGAKTTANSMAVNIASDQTVPITGSVTVSGTVNPSLPTGFSNAGGSISSQQSYTSSGANKWVILQADPANTDNMRFGSVSTSSSSGMVLAPGQDSGLIPWGPTQTLYAAPVSGTQKINITFIF